MTKKEAEQVRRKFDISKYFYVTIAVFSLIGGGFGFYTRVSAENVSRSGISNHNGRPEAHYEVNKATDQRLNSQDLMIIEIRGSVARVETMYENSKADSEVKQQQILDLLNNL